MLQFYQAVQSWHNPGFDALFIALSFLGSEPVYIVLVALVFWNYDKRLGFRLAVLFLASMAANNIIKDTLQFRRPIGSEGIRSLYLSSATGSSFPSGHAQAAATCYPYLWQRWRSRAFQAFGIAMLILIGFSRLYLGLHWPQDVLGGLILGLASVYVFQTIDERLFKLPCSLWAKLMLSALMPLLVLAVYHSKQGLQVVGFVLGFASGYFLEDRFLDYRERTPLLLSLGKTALALGIIGLWVMAWRPLAEATQWAYLPIMAGAGLLTSFIAPWLFRRLHWERPGAYPAVRQD